MLLKNVFTITESLKRAKQERPSLSTYFPKGTQFFYGYPSGDDSGFLNLVSPATEEMVAARVVCCAGEDVTPVCFYATTSQAVGERLLHDFGVPVEPQSALVISPQIGPETRGEARNVALKRELKAKLQKHSFVMAQPYLDADLAEYYQIRPSVTAYCNDKHHMTDYIGEQWLPKRLHAYENGAAFTASDTVIALPAVVKVSASSSGDGVAICKTPADLEDAVRRFGQASGRIIVEEHIDFQKSYGVHFGIPADPAREADLIGVNEQITTVHGEFLGGIIEHVEVPAALEGAVEHLMEHIVPQIRAKGWYGIGGFDVLVDAKGRAFFIDANFRMTGMSAYHFLIDSGVIHRPIMSVLGEFHGNEDQLRAALGQFSMPSSSARFLKLICMSRHDDIWRFNGALEYKTENELADRVKLLLDAGVRSDVLETVYRALHS
ncbi:MAG: ATP-grasp domain-containing protein [Candidatus Saccharimonadales bacterium]